MPVLDVPTTPSPRHLILKLLLAGTAPLSARDAIGACSLFGIRENSVRVAITRLTATGMLEAEGGSRYRLGPNATELAKDVGTWRTAESRVRDWNGAWIGVHCGALGRVDRTALRRRDRALRMLGFRELERDLFVRPDNFVGGVTNVRERLYKLGLEAGASVFVLTSLDREREARARSLWNGEELTRSYVEWRARIERWQARSERLDLKTAARQSFELGNDAIRQLVFDPLLPAPLIDVEARRALVESVLELDRAGRAIWRKLRAHHRTSAPHHSNEEVSRHADS